MGSTEECSTVQLLASSLEYPQRIEWTQLLKRSLLDCSLIVSKFSHFSLFHPSLFIKYSTEECSTLQLLASSLEYPERIRVVSVFETFILYSLFFVLCSLSANFLIGQLPRVSRED